MSKTIDTLSKQIGELAREKGLTVVTAESFTGGGIAAALTAIPDAGEYFIEGVVSYADSAKCRLLGVKEQSIETLTAVSEQVASEMAEGARARADADVAVATTGYAGCVQAGSCGGEQGGAYYIAVADRLGTRVFGGCFSSGSTRAKNTSDGIVKALKLLQQTLAAAQSKK